MTQGTKSKLSAHQRGMGSQHRRERAALIARMVDGQPCCLCGGPMYRANARDIHYDHTTDRTGYRGLAHGHCNVVEGARRGAAARTMRRRAWRLPTW